MTERIIDGITVRSTTKERTKEEEQECATKLVEDLLSLFKKRDKDKTA